MVGLASMKCAHRLLSSSPLIRMELGSPRSVTASLVSNANDCVCFPFMLVPTSSWPDCLPPPKPQTRWHWSLPSPRPASFSDLESSPFLPPRCGKTLPLRFSSLYLLHGEAWSLSLLTTNSTTTATGMWRHFKPQRWLVSGTRAWGQNLGLSYHILRPQPHISPEIGPDSCLWSGGNPLLRLSCWPPGLAWPPTCTLILTFGMELNFSGGAVPIVICEL